MKAVLLLVGAAAAFFPGMGGPPPMPTGFGGSPSPPSLGGGMPSSLGGGLPPLGGGPGGKPPASLTGGAPPSKNSGPPSGGSMPSASSGPPSVSSGPSPPSASKQPAEKSELPSFTPAVGLNVEELKPTVTWTRADKKKTSMVVSKTPESIDYHFNSVTDFQDFANQQQLGPPTPAPVVAQGVRLDEELGSWRDITQAERLEFGLPVGHFQRKQV
eukprot:g2997.t1